MTDPGEVRRQRAIPERFESLLRSTSELIGAQIELRVSDGLTAYTQPPPAVCIDCSRFSPEAFQACQTRRQEEGIRGETPQPVRHWVCPHQCELFTLPVLMSEGPSLRLVAVRPPIPEDPLAARFGRETLRFLTNLTSLLSEHLNLSEELMATCRELTHRSEELNLLHTISGRLTEEEDLRRAIREILVQARGAFGADAAILSIEGRRLFEFAVNPVLGDRFGIRPRVWRRFGNRLSSFLVEGHRRYFTGSCHELGMPATLFGGPAQVLAVALQTQEKVEGSLGLIHLGNQNGRRSNEVRMLDSLAERFATVLANIDLYENLRDFLMATVKSLVSAIDAKDPYTSGHSERVNILSMLIGKTMGLEAEELEVLRWASILHDVGKIGMPESILKKQGRLTPEEFEIVKEHPDRGYRVLAPIRQLSGASMGVRCHHERVDGGGYPLGLYGQEIPLPARIIAVADTYDALTSTRSYRPRTSPDRAFAVIQEARGSQVDGKVVDVLEQLMPFIREHQVMIQTPSSETPYALHPEADAEAA